MMTLLRSMPCERVGEPVEIGGAEYQVWEDPSVMGLDRYYVTADDEVIETRLKRDEAAHYLWLVQWPPGSPPRTIADDTARTHTASGCL